MEIYLLLGVVVVGLIHGLEPGHGWPIAITYSIGKSKPYLYGFISSGIISLFHFLSTVAVVIAFLIFNMFINIPEIYLDALAVTLLVGLGIYVILKEEDDEHHVVDTINLRKIAYIAFIIGFAHEEEFMLIGLILSGIDPTLLVLSYTGSVTFSLISITMAGIKTYDTVKRRVENIDRYLSIIAGGSMILVGISILMDIIIET